MNLLSDAPILVPAYGRDYKTEEEVLRDYKTLELDFKIAHGGPYCSIRDFRLEIVVINYDNLTKSLII